MKNKIIKIILFLKLSSLFWYSNFNYNKNIKEESYEEKVKEV